MADAFCRGAAGGPLPKPAPAEPQCRHGRTARRPRLEQRL